MPTATKPAPTRPAPIETVAPGGAPAKIAKARHTAKAYQKGELSSSDVDALLDLLRWGSSSVNSQPWHFVVATTPEGRDRIAKAGTDADYPFNSEAIRHCGMAVVFASRLEATGAYLDHLLEVEDKHGRFPEPGKKEEWRGTRALFVDLNRSASDPGAREWMARQTYWNGGAFLLGAAALGLDATPMEGIDPAGLDAEFGLADKGYAALFAVTVGRNADAQDWNFALPKSRLSLEEVVTRL